MATYSRPDVAEWARLSPTQLDYFTKLGVTEPDVGDKRKRYSLLEARLTVIAGRALAMGISPRALIGPIGFLRENLKWPEGVEEFDSLHDMHVAMVSERARALCADFTDGTRDALIKWVASEIYAASVANDFFSLTDEQKKKRYESAILETDETAILARVKAADTLKQPMTISAETLHRLDKIKSFELAARDKGGFFVFMNSSEDDWWTYFGGSMEPQDGRDAYVVIDVRNLFKHRATLV